MMAINATLLPYVTIYLVHTNADVKMDMSVMDITAK